MPTPTLRSAFFATLALVASTGARLDAAAGDLDCTFDADGRVIANFTSLEMAQDVEVLADGSIVTIASSGTDLRLSRFLANGALDSSFGGTGSILHTFTGFTFGGADFVSSSVRFDRDSAGNFLVVGSAIVTGGDREAWVGRFTPAGGLDTTFGGGDGWVSFDWAPASNGSANALDNAYDIAVDASDRPVVGGTLDLNGPVFNPSDSDMGIARLTTVGVLDTTFSGDGIALVTSGLIDDHLRALKIDPSGRVVAVGDRSPISGARDSLIVRLTAVGVLDTSFDGDGIRVFDLTLTGSTGSDGDDFAVDLDFAPGTPAPIVVTGYSLNTPTVARFTDSGAVDTTFSGDGVLQVEFEVGAQDVLEHVIVQPDGKILVTGWPILAGPNFQFSVMRLEIDGDLDPTWAGDGRQTFNMVNVDRAYAAALMTDGRVVLAGSSANDTILVIARLLGDASLITATNAIIMGDEPDPTVPGQSFVVDVAVQATSGTAAPTGNVIVGENGGDTSTCLLVPGGGATSTVSCNLTLNTLGNRTLTANYPGTAGQFCPSTSAIELHQVIAAPPAPSTTTITSDLPDPSVVGQTVTVAYTVTSNAGSPAGSVTVSDDAAGVACSATVSAGQCSLVLPATGVRTLTATFAGNSSFAASSGSASHQVNPAPTTTTITSDAPDPSVVGQTVTVAYTVSSSAGTPAGQVFVTTDGPETCTSTVAAGQCLLTLTAPGARTLTVTYEGNVSFDSSSANAPHQVDPAPTTTTIVSDQPDPSYVGQPVTVIYTVTSTGGTPTGDVTVTASGGAGTCTGTVAAGQCSLTIVGPGERTITASYAGNASFAASSDTDEHQVDPTPTTTTIVSDEPDPSFVGQVITVAYGVTAPVGTPIGNVTITADGGNGVESCTATVADGLCTLILVTPGIRTLTASYPGTLTFAPSNSIGTPHAVNLATTTTTLTSDTPDPSLPGTSVATTWTVLADPPAVVTATGTVTVTVSGGTETCSAPASTGGCSLTLTALGDRTLTASYSGDAATAPSSDDEPHQVSIGASTTAITSHLPEPSVTGQSIAVGFQVSSPSGVPTGSVTVTDGIGGSCTGALASGAGTCSFTPSGAGILLLTASYPGDAQISASTGTANHPVIRANTSIALQGIAPEPSAAGQPASIAFGVAVEPPGLGTPTGFVTVSSGELACTAPLADGVCSLNWPSAGTYEVIANYSGDPNFAPSQTAAAMSHTVTGAGEVAEIPTLGEWGLIGLGLGITLAARRALRRGGASRKTSRMQH